MFSAFKKLTRSGDDRCPAPVPMSSSLQKKFSRGVNFNMKILIKGDRNVGKSSLLQRLQGGPFVEEYAPTDQIQIAPINWTYKNTDHIVKVEVWEVVDKGRTKKKPPLGLKLENQAAPASEDVNDTPVLDATFLDVYKNAHGVILMLDITKPWTYEYVVKELDSIPADIPVIILGNHCDMQHHRQVHSHHIEEVLHQAKAKRTAPVRYAESSMRNGFGLRFLHKFFGVPFLRLQRTCLLEQLQRNQKDMEEIELELNDYQNSDDCHYNLFLDKLANKRRQSATETRPSTERSPSIVLGAGKPIVPPDVNPLLAQSLNPMGIKAQHGAPAQTSQPKQSQYVSAKLMKPRSAVSMETTPPRRPHHESSVSEVTTPVAGTDIEEFYAGALDTSFLDDLSPMPINVEQDVNYETDSDEETYRNPKVTIVEDDLDIDYNPEPVKNPTSNILPKREESLKLFNTLSISGESKGKGDVSSIGETSSNMQLSLDSDFPYWAGDASARRSPEGGEDPDSTLKEPKEKTEKKHKKKKSKEKGDSSDKSEVKEKKHKHKKSKCSKSSNPQQDLLSPTSPTRVSLDYEDYDSI